MTTPGGVPNLPVGALTIDTLASKVQDMTPTAMRGRADERMPGIFGGSNGGNVLSDLTPFGILMRIWSEFNSAVATADPADIEGPEDLPDLLLSFIEDLPVVGELVGLLDAIMGTYEGDDPVLVQVQNIFTLIRNLFGGLDFTDIGSLDPSSIWEGIISGFLNPLGLGGFDDFNAIRDNFTNAINGTPNATGNTTAAFGQATQKLLSFLKSGADGTDGTDADGAATQLALAGLRDAAIANAAEIALLKSGGTIGFDDFLRVGANLGSDWSLSYPVGSLGTWGTDGANAAFDPAFAAGTREAKARWLGAVATTSTTDYQDIKLVLASAPDTDIFKLYVGHNDLIGRIDTGGTNYVRFRVGGDGTYELSRFVSGAQTVMKSGTTSVPGAAATVQFLVGEKATTTLRKYRVKINNVDVFVGAGGWFTESGTASLAGASYRGWGMGCRVEAPIFGIQIVPGKVNQWLAQDQT